MTKRRDDRRANRLTKEEAEELVRQSDEAVFGPAPSGFVSKHTFAPSDMVARVRAIDWFMHCGETWDFDLTMGVEPVKTWLHALEALKSRAWDDAILEAHNQLTVFLSKQHRERYQEWNKITDTFKRKVVNPLKEQVWEPFRKNRGLDVELIHSTEWNILAALMENAYIACNHGSLSSFTSC